jgi:hypothetical protein
MMIEDTLGRALARRFVLFASALVISLCVLPGCSSQPSDAARANHPKPTMSTSAQLGYPTYTYHVVAVGPTCLSDIQQAAQLVITDVGQNPPPGEAQTEASALDCQTVNEWATATASYPDATGSTGPDNLALDLGAICGSLATAAQTAPLCVDAKRVGLDSGPVAWG